jgi:hypothetical protein
VHEGGGRRALWMAQPEAVPPTLPLAHSWHPWQHFDKRSWYSQASLVLDSYLVVCLGKTCYCPDI